MILAQTKPVQMVLPGGADGRLEPALRIGGTIAAVALALALAVLLLRVRNRRYDPAESAFVKLARSGGLSRRERRALRALARDAGVDKPVALLLSPTTLRRAIQSGGDAALGAALVRKLTSGAIHEG